MNTLRKLCLVSALLALPSLAQADTKPAATMKCPMMADMGAMQTNMSGMTADMEAMSKGTSDPALKARMQKMHDQMAAMMASMRKMNGGMMGGGMMGGGMMNSEKNAADAPSAAPPVTPEDHAAHHPKQ